VQGVAKRALEGNASNKQADKVGAFVKPLAQMALSIIEQADEQKAEQTTADSANTTSKKTTDK
jgi:hypothetical protein